MSTGEMGRRNAVEILAGLILSKQASSPIPSGALGLWVDNSSVLNLTAHIASLVVDANLTAGTLTSVAEISGQTILGLGFGSPLASGATITPTKAIHHVTGTAAIDTITAPALFAAGISGQITLIPDAIWTTTTSGNIALASTAVVGKALIMTYDPGLAVWYPSY